MKLPYNFNYTTSIPKLFGGGKGRAFIKCGEYQQYKEELRDMLNAIRRELDKLERSEKGKK